MNQQHKHRDSTEKLSAFCLPSVAPDGTATVGGALMKRVCYRVQGHDNIPARLWNQVKKKKETKHSQVRVNRRLEEEARHAQHKHPKRQDAPADEQHVLQRVAAPDPVRLAAALHLERFVPVHQVELRESRGPERASILGAARRHHLRDGVLALVVLGHRRLRVGVDVGLWHGHPGRLRFLGHGADGVQRATSV